MVHSRNSSKIFSTRILIPPKRKGKSWVSPLECESTPFPFTESSWPTDCDRFLLSFSGDQDLSEVSLYPSPVPPSPCIVLTTSPFQYHKLVSEPTQSCQTSQGRRTKHASLPPAVLCPIPACVLPPIVATPPTGLPTTAISDTRCPCFCIHRSSSKQVEWHSPVKIST